MNAKHYQDQKPVLTIQDYFLGHHEASGLVQNRGDEVLRRFHADMHGQWKNDQGILEEHFVFDDGEKQQRTWQIKLLDRHHFHATASDVIGIAQGEQYGNVIHLKYVLRIPVKNKTYDLAIDDWMYLLPDGNIINQSVMSKFGFKVGSINLSIYPARK